MKVKVQKRDGRIVEYNADKITAAMKKANVEVDNSQKVSDDLIEEAIGNVEKTDKEVIPVETIQDIIEKTLVAHNKYVLAKKYMIYRYQRSLLRKSNTTDESILKLIRNENKELAFAEANGSREKLSDEYGELCRRILAAEQKIEALNTRIEERREQDSRIEITEDVLLQKLGVGMQNIIEAGGDVPYLLEDPFTGLKADDKAAMISMFRELTRGKQTLLFTTTNQLKKIYDAMGWPYSGIPV